MKHSFFVFILVLLFCRIQAQDLYFPPANSDEWEIVSPESLNWDSDSIESLYSFLENSNTKAFILLKDGKIALEKYFGTFKQDSVWYWASAGKSLTAFMVGIAKQEGDMNLTDKTSDYLGEGWTSCTAEQENKITIWNQLTMTTGLDDGVDDNYCTLDSCLIYKADAGTRWAYHNAPYTLLDKVIENATGKSMNLYVTQKLKNTTGMTGVFLPVDYNNVFFSTARSMARFGLLMLNRGNWDGNQIITDLEYYNQMVSTSQSLNKSYGYLWWLNGKESFMLPQSQLVFNGYLFPDAPENMFAALGKNGQFINVVPNENLVLVRMGDMPDGTLVSATFNNEIWQKINHLQTEITGTDLFQQKQNIKTEIRIYPNPANKKITIIVPGETYTISISTLSGSTVVQKEKLYDSLTFDISMLKKGIYFIKISTEKGIAFIQKLIINN